MMEKEESCFQNIADMRKIKDDLLAAGILKHANGISVRFDEKGPYLYLMFETTEDMESCPLLSEYKELRVVTEVVGVIQSL